MGYVSAQGSGGERDITIGEGQPTKGTPLNLGCINRINEGARNQRKLHAEKTKLPEPGAKPFLCRDKGVWGKIRQWEWRGL